MKIRAGFLLLLCFAFASLPIFAVKKSTKKSASVITLKNENSTLCIDLCGGAIVGFTHQSVDVNPFTWKVTKEQMPQNNKSGAIFQGHFLCLGRWGAPTDGEMKAGVPHNGQSVRDKWKLKKSKVPNKLVMSSNAPLDGIRVERIVQMDETSAVFKVTEMVKNTTTIGRLFNMVQHATIGDPFLDTSTLIDSNAKEGFMQSLCYPNPAAYEYVFPNAYADSTKSTLDLRTSNNKNSYVSTHIFSDSIGWIVAANPKTKLLVGYVWKTKDYPWLNLWQQWVDGALWAKGLEFGTTGVGKSYQELLAVDTRFHGRNSFFFLDATQVIEKSYLSFELEIPSDFRGVSSVYFDHQGLVLVERNENNSVESRRKHRVLTRLIL